MCNRQFIYMFVSTPQNFYLETVINKIKGLRKEQTKEHELVGMCLKFELFSSSSNIPNWEMLNFGDSSHISQ